MEDTKPYDITDINYAPMGPDAIEAKDKFVVGVNVGGEWIGLLADKNGIISYDDGDEYGNGDIPGYKGNYQIEYELSDDVAAAVRQWLTDKLLAKGISQDLHGILDI